MTGCRLKDKLLYGKPKRKKERKKKNSLSSGNHFKHLVKGKISFIFSQSTFA